MADNLQMSPDVTNNVALRNLLSKMLIKLNNLTSVLSVEDDVLYVAGRVEAMGQVNGRKVGVCAALKEPADTTITVANTYYPINGLFANNPVERFGAATKYQPGIKFLGKNNQDFEIDWHAVFSADNTGSLVSIGVKKNGVLDTRSEMHQTCKVVNEPYSLSGTIVINLAFEDEIQLVWSSDGAGDVLSMQNFTTTISRFFR